MDYIEKLRNRITNNAIKITTTNSKITGTKFSSAFIFDNVMMNLNLKSYKNIMQNVDWEKRLNKIHTYFKNGTKEMQSSNSSDALLMNIFCNPQINKWPHPNPIQSL